MKVAVTKSDIRAGQRKECGKCPISLAINRALRKSPLMKLWQAKVYMHHVELFSTHEDAADAESSLINLPIDCTVFVNDFDDNYPVKPFTFELNTVAAEYRQRRFDKHMREMDVLAGGVS